DLQTINDKTSATDQLPTGPLITSPETTFKIDVVAVAPLNGGEPTFTVDGTLTNFGLNLLNVVVVSFDQLQFHNQRGKKPEINAEGVPVEFIGPLSSVNQLAELMPPDGFSDPPVIQVTPDGIAAGYTLGLPAVGIGAFSLENIALSAEMTLPFVDEP